MRKEVQIWRTINNHPNIVTFVDAAIHKTSEGSYLYILSEYCDEGHLLNLLETYNGCLSENQILLALSHIVSGIKHMHNQNPPIAHRDIKVENILLKNKKFKLCDFGSASEEFLDPNTERDDVIDDAFESYEKYTTFMYRPPEMLDRYCKWEIGTKVDSWMLGCVLFALCYFKHPFQDAQKLAIINAHYFIPTDKNSSERISEKMRDLIFHILTPNPKNRPSIEEIEDIIGNWESIDQIKLNPDAYKIKQEYFRRMKGKPSKPKVQMKPAGDLTVDEINRIQEKIRKQQENKKQEIFVPFYENYEAKMKEDLYDQKSKAAKHHSKSNPKSRPHVEVAKVHLKEETKQIKNFWGDFSDNDKYEKPKKSKSTKDDQEDFSWNFGKQSKETNIKKNKINQKKDDFDFDFGSSTQTKSKEDEWFNFSGSESTQKKSQNQYLVSEGIQTDDDFFGSAKPKQTNNEFEFFENSKPSTSKNNTDFGFDKDDSDDDFQFDTKQKSKIEQDDLFFGSKEKEDDDTECLFGGRGNKEKKYEEMVENSRKPNKEDIVIDEYFGSSENDAKVKSGSSDHIMNKITQLYYNIPKLNH